MNGVLFSALLPAVCNGVVVETEDEVDPCSSSIHVINNEVELLLQHPLFANKPTRAVGT